MEYVNPILEAKRYLDNAKEILSEKASKEGNYYTDSKYVRMAGNTAWNGVLIALDSVFKIKTKSKQRISIDDYKTAAAKRNKQMLTMIMSGYQTLHMAMGYDGNKAYKVCQSGIDDAKRIIDWCEKNSTAKA